MPSVELDSAHPVQAARQILRDGLVSREPLLTTPAERHILGLVQDPDFELIAVGPASEGGAGPLRWRTPSKSRTLRGTITEGRHGTTHVVASFMGPSVRTRGRRRRTEAWLVEWLHERLDVAHD